MGNGNWSDDNYQAAAARRREAGVADFGYSNSTFTRTRSEWTAHPDLDPKGVVVRESRDSAEHPESTPIAILFDVTGSMHQVPTTMQRKLAGLHGLLLRKGYATDPQVMFGAIGDADCDRVPLQVGQFESDNRMDEQLRNIFLEGGGGGQKSESYELAAYFMARHTATDAWDKRGRKGYLFVIGDELNKPTVNARRVREVIGDDIAEDIPYADIYRELQEKWEVFYILPKQTSYFNDPQIREHWQRILGERLLFLEDPAAVCELIGATIGMLEAVVNLDEAMADIADTGSDAGTVVGRALATLSATAPALSTPGTRLPSNLDDAGDDLA